MEKKPPRLTRRQAVLSGFALACFLTVYLLGVPALGRELGATLAVVVAGVLLWVLAPFPLSYTCFLIIFGLFATGAAPLDIVLDGFSSNAVFLVLTGLIIAQGIGNTTLGERVAYQFVLWFGASPRKSLAAFLFTLQCMAFFIPATAVKATLLLPVVFSLSDKLGSEEESPRLAKMFLLGLVFGTHITSLAVLPAALGNVITVELLETSLGRGVGFTGWLLYFFPVSVLVLPCCWFILVRAYGTGEGNENEKKIALQEELKKLGPLSLPEKRLLAILTFTVALWLTDFWHGWPPVVPAILAVVLMAFPGMGIASWERLLEIRWGNILMVGTNISMGYVLIDTGASGLLAESLFPEGLMRLLMEYSLPGLIILAGLVRFYHLFIGNVATLNIIMIPIIFELGTRAGFDPFYPALLAGGAGLLGFMLPIQTMPGVIALSTGKVKTPDFIKTGVPLTLASIAIMGLVARYWWPLIHRIL